MARGLRKRRREVPSKRLRELERALRGGDPGLDSHRAAEALARTRQGARLLAQVIGSTEPAAVREAAVYGFAWGSIKSSELNLLARVFGSTKEHPAVRGQAAEALGPRLHDRRRGQRHHRRYLRATAAFIRGLDDPAPEVRFWSIYALAHPENAWLLPKLKTMESDTALVPGMWTVRQEARWAQKWILEQDLDCDPRSL